MDLRRRPNVRARVTRPVTTRQVGGRRSRWATWLTAAAVASVITALAAAALHAHTFAGLRLRAGDSLFPTHTTDPRVVVVGIDRRAISATGSSWPWSRSLQASLVRRLADAGVDEIVMDVVYDPPTPLDGELADAVHHAGNVVLAEATELSHPPHHRLLVASTVTPPDPVVQEAAVDVGHANITPDAIDGVVRSLPLVVETADGSLIPSMTLAAVARLDGATSTVTIRPHGVQVGGRYIPTSSDGLLEVNYTAALDGGTGDHYFSAADVMGAGPAPQALGGKIALVGLVDPTLGDQHLTPADKQGGVSGIFVQANALNTVLTRGYLSRSSSTEMLLWVFLLGLLGASVVMRVRLWLAALAIIVLGAMYVLVGFLRFNTGHIPDFVYPALALGAAAVAGLVLRLRSEAQQRRRLTDALSEYVSPTVARQLVDRRSAGGELPSGTITFLFTDVVGSTRSWEAWPQAMGEAMRRHDALIEEAVQASGGAVVRPRGEGDSRFAVFVRPSDGAHAAVGIHQGLAMEPWPTPEPVRVRMALHTGVGELREGDYYGSPVNRCARIRSLAGPGQTLLSEATADAVRSALPEGAELRDRGVHELKDLSEPEHVFELTAGVATSAPS